jgi:hypothetical protein
MNSDPRSPSLLSIAGVVVAIVLVIWAVNGEMKAHAIDRVAGLSTTECTTAEAIQARGLGNLAQVQLMSSMSGHEMLYITLRNAILKRC